MTRSTSWLCFSTRRGRTRSGPSYLPPGDTDGSQHRLRRGGKTAIDLKDYSTRKHPKRSDALLNTLVVLTVMVALDCQRLPRYS